MAKILIVEDQALIALGMRTAFEAEGHEVLIVTNAKSFWKAIDEFKPDGITMDIFINDTTTGLELAIDLRKKDIKIPIVFASANITEFALEKIHKMSGVTHMGKPLSEVYLMTWIRNLPVKN